MKAIFFNSTFGHNLEFIHHLYMAYSQTNRRILFILPDSFNEQKKSLDWPVAENIRFDFFPAGEIQKYSYTLLRQSYQTIRLLKQYMIKNKVHEVFVSELLSLMPFLPFFFFTSKYSLYGLIWRLHVYRWKERKWYLKLYDAICYFMMTKSKSVKRIYIGNDKAATIYYNKLFKTNKYQYIPDPFNFIDVPFRDMRKEYDIPQGKKVMYHFGSMGGRKGTIEILRSVVDMDDKDAFYSELDRLEDQNCIMVFDRYCEPEFLQQWCMCCDAILTPYTQSFQSSGLLGYAAQYKKPVIGPSFGMIGKLIRRYKLGITIDQVTSKDLIEAYRKVGKWSYQEECYLVHNSIENFTNIIMQDI